MDCRTAAIIPMNRTKQQPIIVSGISGAGKTTFAQRAEKLFQYRVVNVGEILRAELTKRSVTCVNNIAIGFQFFRHATMDEYLALLLTHTGEGVVLDGVRLVRGVEHIRQHWLQCIHVHCEREMKAASEDPFLLDSQYLRNMADIVIPYQKKISDLDVLIQKEFKNWISHS